jgi:hypothetical protein
LVKRCDEVKLVSHDGLRFLRVIGDDGRHDTWGGQSVVYQMFLLRAIGGGIGGWEAQANYTSPLYSRGDDLRNSCSQPPRWHVLLNDYDDVEISSKRIDSLDI